MNKPEPSTQPPESNPDRKPYTAPRIEESGQFEHLVLTCGKFPMTGGECMLPGGANST